LFLSCENSGPINKAPENFESTALFLQLGLPSTLSRHKSGALRKRSSNWRNLKMVALYFKGGEIRGTKTLNLARNIVSLQVEVDVSRFSPCVIKLSRNKNICCGLKKVVAKSRARVYFVQQILALLLVFHQTQLGAQQICSRSGKSTNQSAAFVQPAINVSVTDQVDYAR